MKKEVLLAVVVIGLSLAFVVVSVLVWLCRGHPWLVRKKLRLGALLLALTGITSGCGSGDQSSNCYMVPLDGDGGYCQDVPDGDAGTTSSCYMAPADLGDDQGCPGTTEILIDSLAGGREITIVLNEDRTLQGSINAIPGVRLSFSIRGVEKGEYQQGDIEASDGAFDECEEEFVIEVNDAIPSGDYFLQIYLFPAELIEHHADDWAGRWLLHVRNFSLYP